MRRHYQKNSLDGVVTAIRLEACRGGPQRQRMKNPFRYFNSSAEVIRLAVMMYVRCPLSLRQVEDLLFKRGIDVSHQTVRFWWSRSCSPRRSGSSALITGSLRVTELGDGSTFSGSLHQRWHVGLPLELPISLILLSFFPTWTDSVRQPTSASARLRFIAVHSRCRWQALRTSPM